MTNEKYKIREICGDWALDIPFPSFVITIYFNSLANAELVRDILIHEDAHPNKAVPFKPFIYPPAHIDREAWEPCEWCGEWIGGDCSPREQDAGYKLYAGYCKQVAADDFYEDETEELNYCPICGRPLTEEAWAEMEKRMRG